MQRDQWKARTVAVEKRLAAMVPMLCQQQDEVNRYRKMAELAQQSRANVMHEAARAQRLEQEAQSRDEQHRASVERLAEMRKAAILERDRILNELAQQQKQMTVAQEMLHSSTEGKAELASELESMSLKLQDAANEQCELEESLTAELQQYKALVNQMDKESESRKQRCNELGESLWDQIHANEELEAKLEGLRKEAYESQELLQAAEAALKKAQDEIRYNPARFSVLISITCADW